jgi:hypothetical protein
VLFAQPDREVHSMRVCLMLLFVAATAFPAFAQDQNPSAPAQQLPGPRRSPDFLFGRPVGSVGIRGSWSFSRARGDWFDFVTDQLTLNRGDFNAPGVDGEVAVTLTDRLQAVIGVDYSQMNASSEYRRFVDNNRQPINQKTKLAQVQVTGSLRMALTDRGRAVSTLAWIPRGVTPFVGAGGGVAYYDLSQVGDFVDALDPRLAVFTDAFYSQGWAPTAHVLGGVDIHVARRLFTTFEGRYRWAKGNLDSQWVDFDPIDLSGFRLSAGINVPF